MSPRASIAPANRTAAAEEVTVSDRIRERLLDAKHRFFANDNIAPFIRDGELDELRQEIEGKLQAVLDSLVIDTEHDHNTMQTARRVAKMFVNEVFRGRYEPAPSITTFPNVSRAGGLMVVGPITVRSTCSHHFCPILGKIWIGVLPKASSALLGLSKYARICAWVMSRPQIQEEAVVTLADELERRVNAEGLALIMETTHFCTHWRGIKDGSLMRSTAMRGAFLTNPSLRGEFLSLVGKSPTRSPGPAGELESPPSK